VNKFLRVIYAVIPLLQVHSLRNVKNNTYDPQYRNYSIEYVAKMPDAYIVVLVKYGLFNREIRKVVLDKDGEYYKREIRNGEVNYTTQAQSNNKRDLFSKLPPPFLSNGGKGGVKTKSTRSKKPKKKKSRSRK
jgi:hypothetical protein